MSFFKFFIFLVPFFGNHALAYAPILRDYQSVRASGMGNVRYTTGLWEENLFANPARSTQNGSNRFQLPKFTFEASHATLSSLSTLLKSDSGLSAFSDAVGKAQSARVQFVFPGYYKHEFIMSKWSFGATLVTSAQTVPLLSQTGVIETHTLVNVGPVINLARRLLPEDRLSVGLNLRTEVRGSSTDFSVSDFLSGSNIASFIKDGNGLGIDADFGASFRPQWNILRSQFEWALAINNVLGGEYKNISKPFKEGWNHDPIAAKRTLNLGVSATITAIPVFQKTKFALECTDIGNNTNGSIYRLLHLGVEADRGSFRFRTGVNQGYLTAGLGIELSWFQFNVATYGEELGLNPGILEDRRVAMELGFHL